MPNTCAVVIPLSPRENPIARATSSPTPAIPRAPSSAHPVQAAHSSIHRGTRRPQGCASASGSGIPTAHITTMIAVIPFMRIRAAPW